MVAPEAVELVVFDCDGVLVDSERLTVGVEARVLTEMGWTISAEEVVERFMGRSSEYMLAEVADRLGFKAAQEFDRLSTEEIVATFCERLEPIDGITKLVDDLHRNGFRTCVASSGSHRKMQLTLGTTGLYDTFEGRIFSASEVDNGKPAPDLFLHAAAQLGVPPQRAVVVEDSVSGVRAARAADMVCYGYSGGLTPADILSGAGAIVFNHMEDLSAALISPD
ncbi:MAG: HAD family hydrolase [Acidimicrobiales bacterium]